MWRGCERLGIIPPGLSAKWEELDNWAQANVLAYEQIREYEEFELIRIQTGLK